MDYLIPQIDERDAIAIDDLLRRCAVPNMVVAELGTYTGLSTMIMLPHVKRVRGRLIAVDWFRGNLDCDAELNRSYESKDVLAAFRANLRSAGYEDWVTTIVAPTTDAAMLVPDESLDAVFIDADHRYSPVRQDIIDWYPKVKPGGLVFGHDFEKHLNECDAARALEHCETDYVDGCHYGVIRAVSEFFPEVQHAGRVWHVRKQAETSPALAESIAAARRARALTGCNGHDKEGLPAEDAVPSGAQHYRMLVAGSPASTPRVLETLHGFNLIGYLGRYYVLAHRLGDVDLGRVDHESLRQWCLADQCLVTDSLDQARRYAELVGTVAASSQEQARLELELTGTRTALSDVQSELTTIKASRSYRLARRFAGIRNRLSGRRSA